MSYQFSPIRFSAILFGLTIAAAVLVGLLGSVTGVDLGGGAVAIVTFLIAIALEARRFGQALTAAPDPKDCWALARQTALTGTGTFVILFFVGSLLMRGTATFSDLGLWIEPLVLMFVLGVAAYVAGFFITRALAQAAWKDRA